MDPDAKRKLIDQSKERYAEIRQLRYYVETARADPHIAHEDYELWEKDLVELEKKWLTRWNEFGKFLEPSHPEKFEDEGARENQKCIAERLAKYEYGIAHIQELELQKNPNYRGLQKRWKWEKQFLDPEKSETIWQTAMAEAAKFFAVMKGK